MKRRQRPTANDRNARPTTTTGHGVHFNALSMLTRAWVTTVLSPSNSHAPSFVIQPTASSMASLATSRAVLSRVTEPSVEVRCDTLVGKSISGPQTKRVASSVAATTTIATVQR